MSGNEEESAEGVMTRALAASLRSDERSWITQRNWDAAGGIAVRLHIRAILATLKANGYAVVELPEPDEFIPAVAGAPKILARWDSVETGEVTVWEGGVVDVFGQTMLSPEDALTFSGVIVRASQIAAAAAAERDSEEL
ncbi:Uncharacterised protein [Mycobacteroides abscessus subsp. bolletii]|uniref:hypothetical protein n=1 Tax=Mycobacteroides abscessus TaxID=36809 RepID=UPI00092A9114|nr:hypothetical protein [Mycobacteroides abscessus]SHQ62285.1 Uncharacterised protein [Mycobacteroides abscessus subsp. bolletii]SHS45964.1 Uncharacterised protein [Mycobacteroides abscessus subsp. bolletii]SHT08831.1 Uncharacterised protein [Mycobacteroides abscessus subsp. bolletii]SHT12867.1 Uncharacterised protein [Mycobacteroides abscessus subsp. bolletii]SHY51657.1 Uncharacterised protein [Mycobacteroides abscessus subsp. bolletii]